MPEFYMIFARKKYLSEMWGQFPALKLRVSGLDSRPQHQLYMIMENIVLRAQSCYIYTVYAPPYVTLQH